jgi:hypothetical protein
MHFCLPLTNLVAGKQKDRQIADTGMDKTPRLKLGWTDRHAHIEAGRQYAAFLNNILTLMHRGMQAESRQING